MAIETPLESVEGEILETDSTRPSVPPGHPMVDQQGQFTKGSPNRDHRCGVLPVQTAVLRAGAQLHINVLELQAIWRYDLRAFSQRVENAKVALMSDNTSAVAYLRNQGGTKSLAMSDLATDLCLWAEKRGMTLIPRHLPGHLNVLADHLSRRGQILKTEWSLNQTVADRIFVPGADPSGSVRPRKKHEIGNVRLPHSGGDVMESGQSRPELGRPVRLCIPSDKPDKGLSKQGQNRKRRDRPDSARLAQSGVVPAPIRSRDRLSNNSPTSAETAQADLTPLSSASMERIF